MKERDSSLYLLQSQHDPENTSLRNLYAENFYDYLTRALLLCGNISENIWSKVNLNFDTKHIFVHHYPLDSRPSGT